MKRYLILGSMILCSFYLSACFQTRQTTTHQFSQETWQQHLQSKVDTRDASPWFFRDVSLDQKTLLTDSINFKTIPVYDFNNIQISGHFEVQLRGGVNQNYVMVNGPSDVTKFIKIETIDQTLHLQQLAASPKLDKVVIRVGIKNLNTLIHQGDGSVEGTQIMSHGLSIKSGGAGDTYLKGNIVLDQITQTGEGLTSVAGAKAYHLDIVAMGDGEISVKGQLSLRSIMTYNTSEVSLIGAKGGNLKILADHSSQISIVGETNVTDITLKEQAKVYIDEINSRYLHVSAKGQSKLGLKGKVNNLFAELGGNSRFYGKNLLVNHGFIKTRNQAHANANAISKLYASANDDSSIYYFGSETVLFSAPQDEAVILPMTDKASYGPVESMKPFFMQ